MTPKQKAKAFAKDLIDLMEKHDVYYLGATLDGDTHCLREDFEVSFKNPETKRLDDIRLCDGYGAIDIQDLKNFLK